MNEMNVTPISPPAGDSSARVQQVVDFYSEKAAAAPRRSEAGESAASPSPQPRTSDVVLRFNVDRETHEVTVYIMDRAGRAEQTQSRRFDRTDGVSFYAEFTAQG